MIISGKTGLNTHEIEEFLMKYSSVSIHPLD